jgi:hypothetical protein
MRHYNVWQLAHAIAFLENAQLQAEFEQARNNGDSRVPDERMNNLFVPMIRYCQTQCEQLELSAALARFPHFNTDIRQGISWSEFRNQVKTPFMSVDTGPVWIPYSTPCRANQFAFALRITFLLGKHAMLGHDPPMYFSSTTTVRYPAWAKFHVRCLPASPLPITRIS